MEGYIELECSDGRAYIGRESLMCDEGSAVLELPVYIQEAAHTVAWEATCKQAALVAPKAAHLTREVVEREIRAQWKFNLAVLALDAAKLEVAAGRGMA